MRFEQAPVGGGRVAREAACLVIVDGLSFTTPVTTAVEAGTHVFPYRRRDETARAFADEVDARLAVGRSAGYEEDVVLATERDASTTVPVRTAGAFIAWRAPTA
ncbi:hypothetical protein ACQYWQ_15070 [Streptomyces sp. P6-2-1]|uniref:hypothetical protein n=1 Tax=Streptomyces sp. P6-2-1 TaxID=3422591 RepID=UPI003D363097